MSETTNDQQNERQYHIGTPGQPWTEEDKATWLAEQSVKRSYVDDVASKLDAFKIDFNVEQYGELDYREYGAKAFPLYLVRTKNWDKQKPTVIITGGVHGYETSGVHGALRFIETEALRYSEHFNILVAPCISPWGYETINRWNPAAVDPNRSFKANSPAQEAANIMAYITKYVLSLGYKLQAHIDLHETTDTDNSEFRPAKSARDGGFNTNWNIPDGFYLVADSQKPAPEFQSAIIKAVEPITHIAPADDEGKLIGETLAQPGVITYPAKQLGLCMGMTDAAYVTTTEVYPDSDSATPEECILAQVAVITGGLDFLKNNS